ncbi:hypothetical protein TSOC_013566, partial [Tetrabaena socialis]
YEFEAVALNYTPCAVRTFDCTVRSGGTLDPARHAFHPLCVGSAATAAEQPERVLSWEGILRLAATPIDPATAGKFVTVDGAPATKGAAVQVDGDGGADPDRRRGSSRRSLLDGGGAWAGSVAAAGTAAAAAGSPNVLILKIDIEGHEWPVFADWGADTPGLPDFINLEVCVSQSWSRVAAVAQ